MKKRPLMSFGIPSAILVLALVFAAMMGQSQVPPAKRVSKDTALPVSTLLLTPQSVSTRIYTQGVVKPRTETHLIAEVKGVVLSVSDKFVTGGFFDAGDPKFLS